MRRARLMVLVGVGFILGASANLPTLWAQDVPYERAMWSTENKFVAALIKGDTETFNEMWHEDLAYWPEGEDRPWSKRYGLKVINGWSGAEDGALSTPMLEPIATKIIDNLAVTHYRLEYTITDKDGTKSKRLIRLTHTWCQTEDGWKLLGGSNTAIEN